MATKTMYVGVVFKGDKMIRTSPKKHVDWQLGRWFRQQPEYSRYSARTISAGLIRCEEYEFRTIRLDE